MWNRSELKTKAKARLHVNYWRMVLVAVILAALTGGVASLAYGFNYSDVKKIVNSDNRVSEWVGEMKEDIEEAQGSFDDFAAAHPIEDVGREIGLVFPVALIAVIIVAIVSACGTAVNIFIKNPLIVGSMGFFADNNDENGRLSKIILAFKSNYVQITLGMFLRSLFTTLWTLLFIVPGIIKGYEYRMIPYILADNPGIRQRDAFEISRRMMAGNKWRAFVLDLSFFGWEILNALTIGILGIFYVNPYRMQTEAELYGELKKLTDNGSTPVVVQEYENYVEM